MISTSTIYNGLTALIGDMTTHAEDYKKYTHGLKNEELEKQIASLFIAKEIVRDYVDPCDIPF